MEKIDFLHPPFDVNDVSDVYDVNGVFPLAVWARHIDCDELGMVLEVRNN